MHNPPKMTAKIFANQTHGVDVQFVHRGSRTIPGCFFNLLRMRYTDTPTLHSCYAGYIPGSEMIYLPDASMELDVAESTSLLNPLHNL